MTENNANMTSPANTTTPKSYSFLSIKKCLGRDDKPYHGVTVSGMVVNPDPIAKSTGGRDYLRFSMPIQNQGPRIWRACEIQPEADDNGTVWANVTFWGNGAQRFAKYLERHPRSIIVVTGSLRVEKTTAGNGQVYTNTNIYADDFMHVRDVPMKKGKAENNDLPPTPTEAAAQAGTTPPPAANASAPGNGTVEHGAEVTDPDAYEEPF